jgi:hypothetical protein
MAVELPTFRMRHSTWLPIASPWNVQQGPFSTVTTRSG